MNLHVNELKLKFMHIMKIIDMELVVWLFKIIDGRLHNYCMHRVLLLVHNCPIMKKDQEHL